MCHVSCGWDWSRIWSHCPWGRRTRSLFLQGRAHRQPALLPAALALIMPRVCCEFIKAFVSQKPALLVLPSRRDTLLLPGTPESWAPYLSPVSVSAHNASSWQFSYWKLLNLGVKRGTGEMAQLGKACLLPART